MLVIRTIIFFICLKFSVKQACLKFFQRGNISVWWNSGWVGFCEAQVSLAFTSPQLILRMRKFLETLTSVTPSQTSGDWCKKTNILASVIYLHVTVLCRFLGNTLLYNTCVKFSFKSKMLWFIILKITESIILVKTTL